MSAWTTIALSDAVLRAERHRVITFLVSLPIVFLLLLLVARFRDHARSAPRILTDPPEHIHPVDLASMWSAYRKHLSPRTAYRAELLHLARLRSIPMDAVGVVSNPADFILTFVEEPRDPIDDDFVRFLFPTEKGSGGTPTVSMKALRVRGERRARLSRWWGDAFDRMHGVIQQIWGDTRVEHILALLVGFFGSVIVLGSVVADYDRLKWPMLTTLIIGWGGWAIVAWVLPAHVPREMNLRIARWKAFRRYLQRFSSVRDAPAAGLVVWDQYLEYAVALGVARRVEHQVKALNAAPVLPSPWHGAPGRLHGVQWFRHLRRRGPRQLPRDSTLALRPG